MDCSPNQIEGCPDLPPRPPLRRISVTASLPFPVARCLVFVSSYAVGTVGGTIRAIDQTNAASSRAIATTMTFCGLLMFCRRR